MGIVSTYGPLRDSGDFEIDGLRMIYEVRGDDHPMVYVYCGRHEKSSQVGGSPAQTIAQSLGRDLVGIVNRARKVS